MAQLELRNATIRFIDGYSNTAAVNDTLVDGDTVIDVDTVNTAERIPLGTRVTIVGNSKRHYVTDRNNDEVQQLVVNATSGTYTLTYSAQVTSALDFDSTANEVQTALIALSNIGPTDVLVTLVSTVGNVRTYTIQFRNTLGDTNVASIVATDVDLAGGGDSIAITVINAGGVTRQITITPAIVTADGIPADNAVITVGGRTLEVKIGEGNLTYNETRTMEYVLDRGQLDNVREGDDVPVDVNFDFVWEYLTANSGDDYPSIEDVLKHRGLAAVWVSSDVEDECRPFAVDIEVEHVPPCGGQTPELVTLPDFRQEGVNHDLRAATVAVTGKCNAKEAIVSRG